MIYIRRQNNFFVTNFLVKKLLKPVHVAWPPVYAVKGFCKKAFTILPEI